MEKIKCLCDKCGREFEAYAHLRFCSMICLEYSKDSIIEIDGETKTIGEWCKYYKCKYHTVRHRVLTGRWSIEDALKTPPIVWPGQSKEKEYEIYCGMLTRCNNPNNQDYRNYGGRGIKVCDKWSGKDGYKHFKADMGERPGAGYSIDRIDVNKGYSPENCRWATPREQANNKVNTQIIEIAGISKPISYWADELGISKYTVRHRLERGWSAEEALLIPARLPNQKISEDEIQKALVQWLELKGYKFWHTGNEVWTSSWRQKIRNKQMGVKAGIPDLTILIPTDIGIVTLYLEIKTETGTMSEAQKEWGETLREVNGVEFRCARGLDECIDIIEAVQGGVENLSINSKNIKK